MSDNLKLLTEWSPWQYSKEMIEESKQNNDGKIIMKGVLQKSDTLNQNGRIYPKVILEREVRNYQKFIAENRALGELDHPESSIVNLNNVSHNVLKIWWDGDDLKGVVQVLDTPSGKILKSLFKEGITLGISSRGLGSVKELRNEGVVEVQDDFELICWDFVSNPSTHGAFMNPISLQEGKVKTSKYSNLDSIINDILRA